MNKKSVVYVVQDDGRKNLTPAMAYGDIRIIAIRDLPLFRDMSTSVADIKHKLRDFDPDNDYIVPSGDPLIIGVVMHHLGARFGVVRCLKWDRQSMDYHRVELPLD